MITRVEARLRHACYYAQLVKTASNLYTLGRNNGQEGLAIFRQELPNILISQEWAAQWSGSNNTATILCLAFVDEKFPFLGLSISPAKLRQWAETALKSARHLGRQNDECVALLNLGEAH